METLFGEIYSAIDLLPRKKVEAFRRNVECLTRVRVRLFSKE
jgi:hypothetical protein